jgi:transcriptional regulator of acetoin/glycerol metabolism
MRRVLTECGGNVSEAARRLGVSRELLRYRTRKHGLR